MSSAANLYPAPGAAPSLGGQQTTTPAPPQASSPTDKAGLVERASPVAVAGTGQSAAQIGNGKPSRLATFEGFLKKAGHVAGIVLKDVLQFALPIASVVAVADPATAPVVEAFTTSVKLVQAAVIAVQQKWGSAGPEANASKLADVLEIVENSVITMFAQAGLRVDTAYVTNLVNGVVAILNAQPGVVLRTSA